MSRYLTVSMVVVASFYAVTAFGAPGETWDVTTRGSGIPEMVMTICLQPGGANDPKQFMQKDSDCEVTDVKTAGKKTSWKMRCGSGDDEMTGTGDVTYTTNSYQGKTDMAGKSGGKPYAMKMTYQGKRIGAECDTDAAPVVKGMESLDAIMGLAKSQMTSAMAEQCEVPNYSAAELISNRFFGAKAACAGKEKAACKVIAKAVAKDPVAFAKLAKYEDTSDLGIAKTCNIDLSAAKNAICPKVNSSNHEDLAEYCPEEARAYNVERTSPAATASPGSVPEPGLIDKAIKLKGLFGF